MLLLKGISCKMHPCGREDIDVRCLGECVKATEAVSSSEGHQ